MTCPNCKAKHVYRLTSYQDGTVNCKYCPRKYTPRPVNGLFIRAINPGSVGKRTVAHDRDISRRMLAEDGRSVVKR